MRDEHKENHDTRVDLGRQTGSYTTTDTETAYECLNRMRRRTSGALNRDHLHDSFEHALDSAEGAEIFTVWEEGDTEESRVIVRNLKDNWQQDTKYLNAPNNKGFITGNTITWKRLGMRWLIVWQDFNYEGYFRGEMFRASHLLSWRDNNGVIQRQWASIRGPVETKAKYDNVAGEYMGGRQNDTLDVWIGANDKEAAIALSRFDKIKVGTRTWRIVVRDDISNPNILRFSCIENFNNDYTDDVINAIPDGLVEFPTEVTPPIDDIKIVGPHTIKEGFNSNYVAKIDNVPVIGDFKVFNGTVEIASATNVDNITIKGTKIKDKLRIEFSQGGVTKAVGEITVVSIFG